MTATTDEQRIEAVLNFWIGPLDEHGLYPKSRIKFWFYSNPDTDAAIVDGFGDDYARAGRGELDHWAQTPRGRLALIIMLDQFTRNLGRGSADAYANDPRGLALCHEGIRLGHDRHMRGPERAFFYMPLEHSESMADQDLIIASLDAWLAEAGEPLASGMKDFLSSAQEHREIIVAYGRYPHRNTVLGRANTPAEQAYLDNSGKSFGQG